MKLKNLFFISAGCLFLFTSCNNSILEDTEGSATIKDISAKALVAEMKAGWNLGNTLDATASWLEDPASYGLESETCWGNPKTTKEIIHMGTENGYKTIRIPVTWYNHIIDKKYTIDPNWLKRVKKIVDWAIEDGYYVILNEHHSVYDNMNSPLKYGNGYIVRNNETDIAESEAFLKAIWTQIATAFNSSYDEHLIFETMNEPRNTSHTEHTWQPGLNLGWCDNTKCQECIADYKILNKYNQICLDVIRATGENNANRFVMIPSLCTGADTTSHELFEFPEDSATDKLILTVHNYLMGVNKDLIRKAFTDNEKIELNKILLDLDENYISKGIPVIVGESGVLHDVPVAEAIKWITYFGKAAKNYGISIVYWDDGGDFQIFDRNTLTIRKGYENFPKAFVDSFE